MFLLAIETRSMQFCFIFCLYFLYLMFCWSFYKLFPIMLILSSFLLNLLFSFSNISFPLLKSLNTRFNSIALYWSSFHSHFVLYFSWTFMAQEFLRYLCSLSVLVVHFAQFWGGHFFIASLTVISLIFTAFSCSISFHSVASLFFVCESFLCYVLDNIIIALHGC